MNPSSSIPLVSIIIIGYNDRKYIGEAIDSALLQTYPNCEIIVVDDGSTDNTGDFISEHFGDRVQYRWKENGGMGSARYIGLQMASGKYIQHLDSDDILLPGKVSSQVSQLEAHPEIAFVYGGNLCFFDNDRTVTWEHPSNKFGRSGNLLREILIYGNFIQIGQSLTRRDWIDHIGGWDSKLRGCDDQDIMIRFASAGAKGLYLNEPVQLYRHTPSPFNPIKMLSRHNPLERSEWEIYIWQKLLSSLPRDSHSELYLVKNRLGEMYFNYCKALFVLGKYKRGVNIMSRGFRYNQSRILYNFIQLSIAFIFPAKLLYAAKRCLNTCKFN